jgi:GH3 auxin-responsive promoter
MRWLIQLFAQLLTPIARSFHQALQAPQVAQTQLQQAIFDQFRQSDYGQHVGTQSIVDWQKIPIVTYDDLRPWINRDAQTAKLTPEPILFHERTSGSRGAASIVQSNVLCLGA